MKKSVLLLPVIVLVCIIASCRKTNNDHEAGDGLYGKWNVVVDSFGSGAGATAHIVAYKGQEGDYYNFDTDGYLYVKEGTNQYKYSYQFAPDLSTITLSYASGSSTFTVSVVSNLTTQQMNLLRPWELTPGGIAGQSVYLKR